MADTTTSDLHPAAKRFIEQLGLQAEGDGLPRIAGMILALLLLQEEPLSFEEIQSSLQVSHGSVSTNARLLESLGMLDRTKLLGDRRVFLQLSDDPYGRLLAGYIERLQSARQIVGEAKAGLPGGLRGEYPQLDEIDRFYDLTLRRTDETLRIWRERR